MAALAAFMVTNLAIELLGGAVSDSAVGRWLQGPLTVIAYVVASLALLVWLVGLGIRLWHALQRWYEEKMGQSQTDEVHDGSYTRHVAEQAAYWGRRLADDAATEAASFFSNEEPSLRQLLEQAGARDPLHSQVVTDLATISESLETWYVRQRQLDELGSVNDSLRQVASRAARPDLEQLAALRSATSHRLRGDVGAARAALEDAKEIAERASRHPCAAALEARQHHEWALIHLAETKRHTEDHKAAADELENAARALEAGWAHLPRADISGQITTLVNLAGVALHQERLAPRAGHRDPAAVERPRDEPNRKRPSRVAEHLGLAEALARAERDLTGLAHVIELRGVAAWFDDQHRLAVERWRDARDRYAELGLADGHARCLQHLGSAILDVPEVAGLLRDNRWVAPDKFVATSEAVSLLERSKALRANLPNVDTEIVDHYLTVARERVSGRLPGDRVRRTDSLRPLVRRFVSRGFRRRKGIP